MSTTDLAIIAAVFLAFCALTNLAILAIWISLRKEIRGMRAELKDEIRAVSVRVSDAELENARMQGAMSVIQAQAHSHDAPPSAGG